MNELFNRYCLDSDGEIHEKYDVDSFIYNIIDDPDIERTRFCHNTIPKTKENFHKILDYKRNQSKLPLFKPMRFNPSIEKRLKGFILLSLYIFGVTLGLLVSSGLLRFGPAFESVAWASLFFLAPLGCIYYPIEILPNALQLIAEALPLVHIFEEMRNILLNNSVNWFQIIKSISISIIYFVFGVIIFYLSYFGAKVRGTLINMGE